MLEFTDLEVSILFEMNKNEIISAFVEVMGAAGIPLAEGYLPKDYSSVQTELSRAPKYASRPNALIFNREIRGSALFLPNCPEGMAFSQAEIIDLHEGNWGPLTDSQCDLAENLAVALTAGPDPVRVEIEVGEKSETVLPEFLPYVYKRGVFTETAPAGQLPEGVVTYPTPSGYLTLSEEKIVRVSNDPFEKGIDPAGQGIARRFRAAEKSFSKRADVGLPTFGETDESGYTPFSMYSSHGMWGSREWLVWGKIADGRYILDLHIATSGSEPGWTVFKGGALKGIENRLYELGASEMCEFSNLLNSELEAHSDPDRDEFWFIPRGAAFPEQSFGRVVSWSDGFDQRSCAGRREDIRALGQEWFRAKIVSEHGE